MDQVSHLSPLIPLNPQVEKIQESKPNSDSLKGQKKSIEAEKRKSKPPAQMHPVGEKQKSQGDSEPKVDIFV